MTNGFTMALKDIQPSQLYISAQKLAAVQKWFDPKKFETMAPIPVYRLGQHIIFTDGHTRALVAYLKGLTDIKVYWDQDDLDWNLYEVCVQWCRKEGIFSVADLADRVVSPADYEKLWLVRCKNLQRNGLPSA